MNTKYYQLRERADTCNSVGVIKSENGVFDLEKIKESLESHFDEKVSNIDIIECGWDSLYFEFNLTSRKEKEIIDAEETWLYI